MSQATLTTLRQAISDLFGQYESPATSRVKFFDGDGKRGSCHICVPLRWSDKMIVDRVNQVSPVRWKLKQYDDPAFQKALARVRCDGQCGRTKHFRYNIHVVLIREEL